MTNCRIELMLVILLFLLFLPLSVGSSPKSGPPIEASQVSSQPLVSILGPPRIEMYVTGAKDAQYTLEVRGARDYQQLRVDVVVPPALDADGNEFPGTLTPGSLNFTLSLTDGFGFTTFRVHLQSELGKGGIYATNITAVAYLFVGGAEFNKSVEIFLTHSLFGIGIVAIGSLISLVVKRPKKEKLQIATFVVAVVLALGVALQFINSNPQFGNNMLVDYASAFVFGFTARVDLVLKRR